MKKWIWMIALLLLAGCGGDKVVEEEPQEETPLVEASAVPEARVFSMGEIMEESTLHERMMAVCGDLKIEYQQVYFHADDPQPLLVGICHFDGDIAYEGDPAYIMAATYDGEQWTVTELAEYAVAHPIGFLGTVTIDEREVVLIERAQVSARYGGRDFSYVYWPEGGGQPEIGVAGSIHTQHGTMRIDGEQVIIEDEAVKETFTFNGQEFQHQSELKALDHSAELVIYIDKNDKGELTYSEESFSELEVKPGDRISFRRKQPIPLANFQIRTDLERVDGEVDTFLVSAEHLGKTIVVGENPFDDMAVFVVGEKVNAKADYLKEEYVQQLKLGKMPGSEIQLTDPNSKIVTVLGPPEEEFGWSGAKYLQYDSFSYAIPFFEEDDDIIYGIMRELKEEERVPGTELRKVWGAPTEHFQDILNDPITLVWNYQWNDEYYISVDFDGDDETSNVVSFTLLRN